MITDVWFIFPFSLCVVVMSWASSCKVPPIYDIVLYVRTSTCWTPWCQVDAEVLMVAVDKRMRGEEVKATDLKHIQVPTVGNICLIVVLLAS